MKLFELFQFGRAVTNCFLCSVRSVQRTLRTTLGKTKRLVCHQPQHKRTFTLAIKAGSFYFGQISPHKSPDVFFITAHQIEFNGTTFYFYS